MPKIAKNSFQKVLASARSRVSPAHLWENAKARDYTMKALQASGYEPVPSYANFILFPIRMKAKTFENRMFGQAVGIQTRDIDRQPYCRVSIGTQAEMEIFVEAFKIVVG